MMKKLNYQTIKGRCFKALIVLLLAPLSSWAQYLTVGGVTVTNDNASEIKGDNVEGTVSFDVSTNTLTLNNATITGGTFSDGSIASGLGELTIVVIGENKLCSTDTASAIRAVADNAKLTIKKGADNSKLVFETQRAIRDFKTVSFDGLFWNGAYTYRFDNAEWQPGYRLMNAEGLEAGYSYDTGVRPTLGDPVPTMSTYSGQSNETRLFLQNDFGLLMYYSIDYVSNDLQDVIATQFTEAPELLGPCTVTAYVKKSDDVNGTPVVGKFFGLAQSSAEAVAGQDEPVKPVIIPAIGEEELSIDFYTEIADEYKVASPDGAELYIGSAGKANFEVRLFDYRETPSFIILNSFVQTDQEVPCYQIGNFNVSVREAVSYGIIVNGEVVNENNMLNVLADDEESIKVIYNGKGTLILNGFEGSIQSTMTDDLKLFLKGENHIPDISASADDPVKLLITTDKQAPGTLTVGSKDGAATAAPIRGFQEVELLNDLCWITGAANAMYAEVGNVITPVVLDVNTKTVEPDDQSVEALQTPPAGTEKVEVKENEGEANETTTIIINKVVDNVLVTLVVQEQEAGQPAETYTVAEKAGDQLTGGGTAERNAFVLQTAIGESDMTAALNETPGTPDYAEVFHGLTVLLAAGSGSLELDVEVPDDAVLNVQIGSNKPLSFRGVTGIITVPYVCKEPTYVYIYNATPGAAEARGYRRAKVKTVPVKMFGLKTTTTSVQNAQAPEAAAKPTKLLTADALNEAMVGSATTGVLHFDFDDLDLTALPDDVFKDISSPIMYIDLSQTSISNVRVSRSDDGPFKGVSSNTFIYLPAGNGNTVAEGELNVVIGAVCDNMQLAEDDQAFSPAMNFGVVSATLGREFVADRTSTVYLPFAVDKATADVLGEFYTFTGITPAGDAGLQRVTTGLAAKTPYIFKKSGAGKIAVKNVSVTTDAAPAATELVGTFRPITWTSQELASRKSDHKYIYGFAAADQGDNIQAGEFVRVGAGATIKPYRAYLEVSYDASRIPVSWSDETTGIRTLPSVKAQEGWFTIGGARLAGAPSKPGLYIYNGKKTIVNGK